MLWTIQLLRSLNASFMSLLMDMSLPTNNEKILSRKMLRVDISWNKCKVRGTSTGDADSSLGDDEVDDLPALWFILLLEIMAILGGASGSLELEGLSPADIGLAPDDELCHMTNACWRW